MEIGIDSFASAMYGSNTQNSAIVLIFKPKLKQFWLSIHN